MRTLFTQMGFTEGPSVTAEGLVWTSVSHGLVYREGEVLADLGGGPNGSTVGPDGWLYVTQNGGIDFAAWGMPAERPFEPVPPGVVRVAADGTVEHVVGPEGLEAPNDLVFLDGTLYFTDSRAGTVVDGAGNAVSRGWAYPNGIAAGPDGLWVADTERRHVRTLDRRRTVEMPGGGGPDGIRFDEAGRLYAACTVDMAVHVFSDGRHVGSYLGDGGGLFTNCCFRGEELIVTSSLAGEVVAFDLGEMSPVS